MEEYKGYSPWGGIQHSKIITRGVKIVYTAGHGGVMVTKTFADKNLTKSAISRGDIYGNYYCYEEDCAWAILYFDLFYNKPKLFSKYFNGENSKEIETKLMKSLSYYNPDYLLELRVKPYEKEYNLYLLSEKRYKLIEEKSPDIIVSAISVDKEIVKVITADKKNHLVSDKSYSELRKSNSLLLLSKCEVVG